MRKILFVTGSQAKSGGTERACADLANELARRGGFALTVLSAADGRRSFFAVDARIALDEIYPAYRSLQLHAVDFIGRLRRYLKHHPHDVIVVVETFLAAFVLPAALGLNSRVVAWEHFGAQVTLGVPVRRLARRLAARYCSHVVVLTNADRELWLARYRIGANRLSCIPNINPMHACAADALPADRESIVLTIGRLVPEKGYDMLIRAWAAVPAGARAGWRLRIVGDGAQKGELEALAASLGVAAQLDLVPRTADVGAEYRRASIFALSSRFEGFGLVIVEAMTFGLPVVSFDCPWGPREILQGRGAGVLVAPLNVEAFAAALEPLLVSRATREAFGERARAALGRYAPETVGDAWSRLLTTLAWA